jgi:hypothetical protein
MRVATFTTRVAALTLALTALTTAGAQKVSPPGPSALRPYVFPKVEQFTLPNGLKVILVEKHTLPVVEGRIILDAGAMREPAAKNGLASLTGRLLSEGTADMTGAEIARQMDALGASFNTGGGFSTSFADVVALTNVFPAGDVACRQVGDGAELPGERVHASEGPGDCRVSAGPCARVGSGVGCVHSRCVR